MNKKQNKNGKKIKQTKQKAGLIDRINKWFILPEDKLSKNLPEDKMIVNTMTHDLMVSILIVSVLINATVFITWLVLTVDPTVEVAVTSLL